MMIPTPDQMAQHKSDRAARVVRFVASRLRGCVQLPRRVRLVHDYTNNPVEKDREILELARKTLEADMWHAGWNVRVELQRGLFHTYVRFKPSED